MNDALCVIFAVAGFILGVTAGGFALANQPELSRDCSMFGLLSVLASVTFELKDKIERMRK